MSKNEHMLEYIEKVDNVYEFFAKHMENIGKEVKNVSEIPMTSEWNSVSDCLSFQCPTLKARTTHELD